jgi:hypothetical protein
VYAGGDPPSGMLAKSVSVLSKVKTPDLMIYMNGIKSYTDQSLPPEPDPDQQ